MQSQNTNIQSLRPTLIMGVGGTGYEIVVRVKARIQETYPDALLRRVSYLVLDTDPNQAPVRNSIGEQVSLDPAEMINIGGVPVAGIRRNIANYPEIQAEIPVHTLPQQSLNQGAKQIRPLGRLAFFHHFETIQSTIRSALNTILNIKSQDEVSRAPVVNIFIVSSVCGGTGSGIIIDLAYLTRYLARQLAIPDGRIFNVGMFVLPEAFPKINISSRAQIRANASATFAELDHFTKYQDFRVTYPTGVYIEDERPPFSIRYLIGASNKNNLTINGMQQLAPTVAEALFLHLGSYLGASTASVFDNIPTAISSREQHGFLSSYSMIGTSTLRFNARRMQQACAFYLTHRLVEDVFLFDPHQNDRELAFNSHRVDNRSSIQEELEADLNFYLSDLRLSPQQIKEQLKQIGGKAMSVEVNIKRFESHPADSMVRFVKRALDTHQQTAIVNGYFKSMEDNQVTHANAATERLTMLICDMIDNPEYGIMAAEYFLDQLRQRFTEFNQSLTADHQRAERDSKRVERILKGDEEQSVRKGKMPSRGNNGIEHEFTAASQQYLMWLPWQQTKLRRAMQRYADYRIQSMQFLLEQEVATQGQLLIERIDAHRQQLQGALAKLKDELNRIHGEAQASLESLRGSWHPTHVLEVEIAGSNDVERFFYDFLPESTLGVAREYLTQYPLSKHLRVLESTSNGAHPNTMGIATSISEEISRYTVHKFDSISSGISTEETSTVEQLMQQNRTGFDDQDRQLDDLIYRAAPLLSYDATPAGQQANSLDTVLVVGVYNRDASSFSEQLSKHKDASLISTFDRHRVSVLHTEHGYPIYALNQYPEYLRTFASYQARTGAFPLLCFNETRSEIETRTLFAKAEAFGLIESHSAGGFYFDKSDVEDEENYEAPKQIHLGNSFEDAVRSLMTDFSLRALVQRKVDKWNANHSHQDAIIALDAYERMPARQPKALDDELRLFVSGAKEYHNMLSMGSGSIA
ncbi:MAG: tubulin-like doman-containing protein [Chloroflexota bacterium]